MPDQLDPGFAVRAVADGVQVTEQSAGPADRPAIAAFSERSLAALLRAETGRDPIGIEIKVNYLAPPAGGPLEGRSRLVHRTRRTALVECTVTVAGQALAIASGTYLLE